MANKIHYRNVDECCVFSPHLIMDISQFWLRKKLFCMLLDCFSRPSEILPNKQKVTFKDQLICFKECLVNLTVETSLLAVKFLIQRWNIVKYRHLRFTARQTVQE